MHVVAIAELGAPIAEEAPALAADLGSSVYDERLNLNAGLPAVVLATADAARARTLLERLRGRGHGALACEAGALVSSERMVSMRRFRLEPDAIVEGHDPARPQPSAAEASPYREALDAGEERPPAHLPFASVSALLRASRLVRTEKPVEVKEKKFALGRAVVSGGLMMTKTVTRQETSVVEDREQLLYLFRRDGQPPWILYENGTHFSGLGGELAPSALANFFRTVERLRQLAPHAVYDERFLKLRRPPERAARAAAALPTLAGAPEGGMDLLAHLLARWIARP
jgi:hypothetical protein